MFYQGSLQEGISAAVGQQKLVHLGSDDNEESKTWENDFLREQPLDELIASRAIALRLEAGSESAAFLAQIFPLPKTPTVVIMKHGELREYIAGETTKDDFVRRVQSAFDLAPTSDPSLTMADDVPPSTANGATSQSSAPQEADNVRRALAERAAKLQAEKDESDRREKDERAKRKAKAAAEAQAGADTAAARTHRMAEELQKQRQKKDEERRRILKRIEDDKHERRQRSAQRQQNRIDGLQTGDVASSLVKAPESKLPSTTRMGDMASIQVRIFDGSTIRSRFKTSAHFGEVRAWVDENRSDGSAPYTFRQLLTPKPNLAIDEEDETKTLADMGLAPSSTLILVPVQKSSTAYEAKPRQQLQQQQQQQQQQLQQQNLLARIIFAISALAAWLTELLGFGGRATAATAPVLKPESAESTSSAVASGQGGHRRIRDFDNVIDQPRDQQQLYNGNSLNFEPRPEDENDI
ncbi:hypothetical protein L249_3909 [Ophiocordyceps polyrhachis-furcata BCC 54312]|uniref:UBX domain-containing protein 2 n=1 Tax=Ophiocordyceps polyrhachis-furcata BCC 54312 TaxID=1330021 RepID=A0A367L587_9HYPO|nr:hypothetical protein L249_3909 [Ophiocordyceps polyrhachis-furcata BCC 54312]